MRVTKIVAKLGTMRKAQEWIVYPASRTERMSANAAGPAPILIQSDTRIAQFDPATGIGVLSASHPNGSYFLHLNKFAGATDIVVPPDIIAVAIAAIPKSGDEIGPGVTIT